MPRARRKKIGGFGKKRARVGWLFVLPYVVGLLLFFIKPLMDTIYYSFATLTVNYETGFQTVFEGFRHYRRLFTGDPDFLLNIQAVLTELLYRIPTVVVFSVFTAVLLNRNFKGRFFFRAVFFLPVIIMSGAVADLILADHTAMSMMGNAAGSGSVVLNMTVLNDLLTSTPLASGIINFLTSAVNGLINISWVSGVQILLILAGLQSISPVLYEAAKMEGASSWSTFWKITMPMTMPVLFIVVVYTIIDYFMDSQNSITKMISTHAFSNFRYSYASAIAVIYSLIVFIVVLLVTLTLGRSSFLSRQR